MPPLQSVRTRAGRVLLASSNPHTQATLRAMLAGCDAVTEIDEAWSLARGLGLSRACDLVLLDATEAGRLGVTAALVGLRAAGAPAVIVVAADADPEVVRTSLDGGAVSFALTWSDLRALHHRRRPRSTATACADRGRQPALEHYPRTRCARVMESLAPPSRPRTPSRAATCARSAASPVQLASPVDPRLARSDEFLFGCLLHDVGKIGVPERILTKPGPLTDDEWVVMRSHPDTGARVVEPLGLPQTVVDIVRHHHERWDGAGYPDGLAGDAIPLAARIFAVCDALDAMTSERPYRDPLPHSIAYARVRREAGRQFDPAVIGALERGVLRGEIELGGQATSTHPATRVRAGGGWAGRPGRVRLHPQSRRHPSLVVSRAMSIAQRYRLRTPSTGREVIIEAEPGKVYRDRETGEELEVRREGPAARAVHVQAALGGREPALLQLVRPARPEGPQRLPALRAPDGPAAAGLRRFFMSSRRAALALACAAAQRRRAGRLRRQRHVRGLGAEVHAGSDGAEQRRRAAGRAGDVHHVDHQHDHDAHDHHGRRRSGRARRRSRPRRPRPAAPRRAAPRHPRRRRTPPAGSATSASRTPAPAGSSRRLLRGDRVRKEGRAVREARRRGTGSSTARACWRRSARSALDVSSHVPFGRDARQDVSAGQVDGKRRHPGRRRDRDDVALLHRDRAVERELDRRAEVRRELLQRRPGRRRGSAAWPGAQDRDLRAGGAAEVVVEELDLLLAGLAERDRPGDEPSGARGSRACRASCRPWPGSRSSGSARSRAWRGRPGSAQAARCRSP